MAIRHVCVQACWTLLAKNFQFQNLILWCCLEISLIMITTAYGSFATKLPAQSHFCVSSCCPCTACVRTRCKTPRRCQNLSAINPINQTNDDSNLSAAQNPRGTSQVIYRYRVIHEHGTSCSSLQDVSVDVTLRPVWDRARKPTDRTGHWPHILLPSAQLPCAEVTERVQTDGLVCLINTGWISANASLMSVSMQLFLFLKLLLTPYM